MLLALSLSGCAQQEPNAELQAAVKQDAKAIVGKYFEIPSGKSFLGFDDWTILALR
jgi:hypothetical protein